MELKKEIERRAREEALENESRLEAARIAREKERLQVSDCITCPQFPLLSAPKLAYDCVSFYQKSPISSFKSIAFDRNVKF